MSFPWKPFSGLDLPDSTTLLLEAIKEVDRVLEPLTPEARRRVLEWAGGGEATKEREAILAIVELGLCRLAPCEHIACGVMKAHADAIRARGSK